MLKRFNIFLKKCLFRCLVVFLNIVSPLSFPFSRWQILLCPANVVSTAAACFCNSEPSVRGLRQQWRSSCLHWSGRKPLSCWPQWESVESQTSFASTGICFPLHHISCHSKHWNEEKNIKWKQLWKQHLQTHVANPNLNLAYFLYTHFASTHLVNLPPFDSKGIQ